MRKTKTPRWLSILRKIYTYIGASSIFTIMQSKFGLSNDDIALITQLYLMGSFTIQVICDTYFEASSDRYMKPVIILFCMAGLCSPARAQDTVYLNGTNKVLFKVQPAQLFFTNCTEQFATATTTVRKVANVGNILFKPDGNGYITPLALYKGGTITYYFQDCPGLKPRTIYFITKPAVPTTPPVTGGSPSFTSLAYNWGRTIGNSSSVQYGPQLIRGLRNPTGIVECNGWIYMTTGLVEGSAGMIKVPAANPTTQVEIDPPVDNDFKLNMNGVCSYGGIVYGYGFDSYGAITSAVIAYKDDQPYIFAKGKPFQCKWQANPYKSGIHINVAQITGIDVDATLLYVYCGKTCYQYDRLTGDLKASVSVPVPTYLSKYVSGPNALEMTSTDVKYNGQVICKAQTTMKVDNYTYTPKDFNEYINKGSVCIGTSGLWVVDNGNCRVLHYDMAGKYINQIAYIPMNYNGAVDRGNPTRVFSGTVEYKVSYPKMTWECVANYSIFLDNNYLPAGHENNARNLMRDVVTTPAGTFCFITRSLFEKNSTGGWDETQYPTLFKITETSLQKVKEYDAFSNLSLTPDGKVVEFQLDQKKATFYLDGVLKETITITAECALGSTMASVGYTSDGYFVVYNPTKEHKGFHLTWVKGGKLINAMPTKTVTGQDYPYGDLFCIDGNVEYPGGYRVYVVGTKIFVNYVGEFFGGGGGQTNLWFEYENGKFIQRVGKTSWEAIKIDGPAAPRETAGNSYGGGVVLLNGKYYIITNCEHTGALQWFEIN